MALDSRQRRTSAHAVSLLPLLGGFGPYDDPGFGPVSRRHALALYAFAPSAVANDCRTVPTASTRTTGIPASSTRTSGVPTSSTRTGAPSNDPCPCDTN